METENFMIGRNRSASRGTPPACRSGILSNRLVCGIVLAALLTVAGCAQVQTLSTPNPVTVQEFGCGGDIPSPYPPYCRQPDM